MKSYKINFSNIYFSYGKPQVRSWRTLYARNMGRDTKLAKYFKETLNILDSFPVEITTVGYSWLSPMRGDRTHFGEFRGTWRDLLTINYTKTEGSNKSSILVV